MAKFSNLKKLIENNPYIVLIGAAVSVAVIVVGVMTYLHGQKIDLLEEQHKLETSKLETRLSSISRRLGDKQYLDIRSFIYSGSRKSEVPANAKYYQEDNFYAPGDDEYWSYSKLNEQEYLKLLTNGAAEFNDLPKATLDAMSIPSVHFWRGKDVFSTTDEGKVTPFFPYISVVKTSIDVRNQQRRAWMRELHEKEPPEDPNESQQRLEAYEKMFKDDSGAFFLTERLGTWYALSFEYRDVIFRVVTVQKVENVSYVQALFTFPNANIDNLGQGSFFLTREEIIISTPTHIYSISTNIPSLDPAPRSEAFNRVTKWFDDLAVITD